MPEVKRFKVRFFVDGKGWNGNTVPFVTFAYGGSAVEAQINFLNARRASGYINQNYEIVSVTQKDAPKW